MTPLEAAYAAWQRMWKDETWWKDGTDTDGWT